MFVIESVKRWSAYRGGIWEMIIKERFHPYSISIQFDSMDSLAFIHSRIRQHGRLIYAHSTSFDHFCDKQNFHRLIYRQYSHIASMEFSFAMLIY